MQREGGSVWLRVVDNELLGTAGLLPSAPTEIPHKASMEPILLHFCSSQAHTPRRGRNTPFILFVPQKQPGELAGLVWTLGPETVLGHTAS